MTLGVFGLAALLLAVERVAYAWIWHRPDAFREAARRCGIASPVYALQLVFYFCKALQVAVFAAWCWYFGALTGWPSNWLTPVGLAAFLLIGVGQCLNAAVFIRLGRAGVFYGNRFGQQVPWVEGFPFSVVRHPQYAGTVMTIWGLFLLLRFPYPDWWVLPLLETAYYWLGARAERSAPDRKLP